MTKDPIQQGLAILSIICILILGGHYAITQTSSDALMLTSIAVVFAGMIYTTVQIRRNANNPEVRKKHGRYGMFFLFLFFLMLPLTMITQKEEVLEIREAEQKKWEDPMRFHYIILPQSYADAMVSINGATASSTNLEEEGKTLRFYVDTQYIGKESILEIHLRSAEGEISAYSKKVVLAPAPDTLSIDN